MRKPSGSIKFYAIVVLLLVAVLSLIVHFRGELSATGKGHAATRWVQYSMTPSGGFDAFLTHLKLEMESTIGLLLLQIIVILIACRIFGWLFLKLGQPSVIGEILAGIVLGPSILGSLAPEFSQFLFKEETLDNINMISAFGLMLFMFAIGMELDISEVRKKIKTTILISHTSTIVPFITGAIIAYFAYDKYAGAGTPFLPFALFIGVSMSITAFPVLARIIQEKKLTKSHLGMLTLACAANGDLTAWCMLALVVAVAQAGSVASAVFTIAFACVYLLIMFFPIRKFLRKIGKYYNDEEVMDKWMVALMFLILTCSAYLTQILGLHSLFGAFIAGVVMPEHLKFRRIMTDKVEDVALSLFLPLFFVSTGLRTEIALLNRPEMWVMCGIIIAGAIAGKVGGTYVAARIAGENVRNSLYIGALMNTRGLMELIVLTIGYEMQILPPPIFVMLVIMTLVTTFMTGPLMALIKFCFRKQDSLQKEKLAVQTDSAFRLLLSLGKVESGQVLLDLAHMLFSGGGEKLKVTALHLTVGVDVNPLEANVFENTSFGPLVYGAQKLGIPVATRYAVSNDAKQDIVNIANDEKFDFLLVGAGVSLTEHPEDKKAVRQRSGFLKWRTTSESIFYPGGLLQDKTDFFCENVNCPVGIFINHKFIKATNILLLIASKEDLFLTEYAQTILKSTQCALTLAGIAPLTADEWRECLPLAAERMPPAVHSAYHASVSKPLFEGYNFVMISYATWTALSELPDPALSLLPSTLILRNR
ncbi:MAG: cation:proton antiporter [Tannerellaceae bacterium]|jgi:Kef-type K+ transport system membrane component KefB|nr:cation:proton antiporter [Tannerellaceae bacterium]